LLMREKAQHRLFATRQERASFLNNAFPAHVNTCTRINLPSNRMGRCFPFSIALCFSGRSKARACLSLQTFQHSEGVVILSLLTVLQMLWLTNDTVTTNTTHSTITACCAACCRGRRSFAGLFVLLCFSFFVDVCNRSACLPVDVLLSCVSFDSVCAVELFSYSVSGLLFAHRSICLLRQRWLRDESSGDAVQIAARRG
jgi:hypothetical protein